MKVKTSVTLSEDVLRGIDERAEGNRSEWIERVVRQHLQRLERTQRDRHDTELLNALVDREGGCYPEPDDVAAPWWLAGDEFTEEDLVDAVR
jgi:metal-responsive CopG/Arc/MetJ family transcriptional regulator